METPEFAASWSEVQVVWGPSNLQLLCKVRAVTWGTRCLTCEVWPNSRWLVSEVLATCNSPINLAPGSPTSDSYVHLST